MTTDVHGHGRRPVVPRRSSSRSVTRPCRAKTFRLRLPAPQRPPRRAARRRAPDRPDGYTAQRSYSVASAPDGSDELELTVELLRRRRGVVVPPRGRRRRRRARAARPAGRVLRVGRHDPGAPRRRRIRRRAAHGDAPAGPPRQAVDRSRADGRLGALARRPPVRRRARRARDVASSTPATPPAFPDGASRRGGRSAPRDVPAPSSRPRSRRDGLRVRFGRVLQRRRRRCSSTSASPVGRIRTERFGPTG